MLRALVSRLHWRVTLISQDRLRESAKLLLLARARLTHLVACLTFVVMNLRCVLDDRARLVVDERRGRISVRLCRCVLLRRGIDLFVASMVERARVFRECRRLVFDILGLLR